MATPDEFSIETIGHIFVTDFYKRLHYSPEIVHGFFKDQSTMIRPDPAGRLVTVTTTKAINDLLLSFDYTKFIAEILAVDTQSSHMGGLAVLVTGCLTGLDNVRRLFVESFFLAPQEKGYYVLNDTFRFIDEPCVAVADSVIEQCDEVVAATPVSVVAVAEKTAEVADKALENHAAAVEKTVESAAVEKIVEAAAVEEIVETAAVEEVVETTAVKEIVETTSAPVEQQKTTTMVKAVPQAATVSNYRAEPIAEALRNGVLETPKKKTFAEMLKNPNQVPSAYPAHKRASPAKPVKHVEAVKSSPAPVPQVKATTASASAATTAPKSAPVPVSQNQATTVPAAAAPVNGSNGNVRSNGQANSNGPAPAKGYSIYIGHLPYDANPELVEQEFKRFGSIKKNGIQVRSNQGYVFGFVEFEEASAQEKALETGTIQIGGKEVQIEEKRATARADGYTGRGGYYRNDGYRRGNYSNSRGYPRNDNDNRRNGEGAPRGRGNGNAYVNGGGRGNGNASVNGGRSAPQGAATK